MSEPLIEFDPPAYTWTSLIEFDPARNADERARFGLPTDRPIIMAGHQGGFWHVGIAAKLFAARSLAERFGGETAWLVVDTVDTQPTSLRLPVRDQSGQLIERTIRVDRDTTDHARAAEAIEAFGKHATEPSSEVRATLATMDLLPGPMPRLIRSSQLNETTSFRTLVERFTHDPASARALYNAAIETQPAAGMSLLAGDAVPFWRVTPRGARLPAREADLDSPLWPRALAMTGVVRASLCDLFIHGTGGGIYEPINDRWLADGLGWSLAPFATTTATLRLRFEGEAVTEAEAAHAAWRAQHARHHPGLLGDTDQQYARDRLVRQISEAPRDSAERAGLFATLHAMLGDFRTSRASQLDALAAEANGMRTRAAERGLRNDRTWPAVLHEPGDLEVLRDAIDAHFNH